MGSSATVDAADLDRARVGPAQAEQQAEQGGLARAVGPDQADPTGGEVEVDVVEGGDAAGYRFVSPRARTMLVICPPTLPAGRSGSDVMPSAGRRVRPSPAAASGTRPPPGCGW